MNRRSFFALSLGGVAVGLAASSATAMPIATTLDRVTAVGPAAGVPLGVGTADIEPAAFVVRRRRRVRVVRVVRRVRRRVRVVRRHRRRR